MKVQSRRFLLGSLLFVLVATAFDYSAQALPAFARKEKVGCSMCHMNGSYAKLTKYGYIYRRAGYRNPADIGNESKDADMNTSNHFSAAATTGYTVATTHGQATGSPTALTTNSESASLGMYPLVGAYGGNYGVWSEVDFTATTAANVNTALTGGLNINSANLHYVRGSEDSYFGFRGGLLTNLSYGIGDRGIGGGSGGLFNSAAFDFNKKTYVTPTTASQFGVEFSYNFMDSHLSVGILQGMDGSQGASAPYTTDAQNTGHKDIKVAFDQFIGDDFAITAIYYNGMATVLAPKAKTQNTFNDVFSSYRLYLTYEGIRSMRFELGGAYGTSTFATSAANVPNTLPDVLTLNTDHQKGVGFGYYYMMSHLTLGVQGDYANYSSTYGYRGYNLSASMPYENNQFSVAYNNKNSDESGLVTQTYTATWKLMF